MICYYFIVYIYIYFIILIAIFILSINIFIDGFTLNEVVLYNVYIFIKTFINILHTY